jgi:hypothetical protein
LEFARREAVRWRFAKTEGVARGGKAKESARPGGEGGRARLRLLGEWLTRIFFWVGYLFTLLLAWSKPWALLLPPLLLLAWWWEGRGKIDREAGLLVGAVLVALVTATLFQEIVAGAVSEEQAALGIALSSGLALVLAVLSGRLLLALAAKRGGKIAWYAEISLLLAPVVFGLFLVLFTPLLYPSLFRGAERSKELVGEGKAS